MFYFIACADFKEFILHANVTKGNWEQKEESDCNNAASKDNVLMKGINLAKKVNQISKIKAKNKSWIMFFS